MIDFARNSKKEAGRDKISRWKGKAILSWTLCLTLMVGMLSGISLTAKADGIVAELWSPDAQTKIAEYETLQAAFSAAETAGVYAGIKLMQDVTVSESLTLNQDINLFLNGHTLTVNEGGAITTGVTNFTPNIDVWSGTSEGAGGSIVISGKVSAYMNVGSGDVSVSVNGGETQRIMMYDGTINITGGTIQHVQTWGTANVSGGTIGFFGPENGVSTIIGGTIEHVDMLNNDGSPTLDIRGNVNITDELMLEYYGGDEYSGIATVTVSGTPQIARIGFQYAFFGEGEDTGEGNWGSLTITGGYFGNNPNTVFALNDIQAGHITVTIDEIEEYSNQTDWADSDKYKFRIVGTDGDDDDDDDDDDASSYTVVFNTSGGTQIPNQTVEKDNTATKPANPEKEHYTFTGWYADAEFTTAFDFGALITADTTVYAKWSFDVAVVAEDATEATAKATAEVKELVEKIVAGAEVEGMDVALVGKINDAIQAGKDIKIELTAQKVEEAAVQTDADKVKETINNDTVVAAYFDIDINVVIDGEHAGNVTKLGDKVTVKVDLPANLPAVPAGYTRVFKVVKVHNGVATELKASVNGTICSFESDEFSTYAVVYEDVKDDDDDDPDDNDDNSAQAVTVPVATAAGGQTAEKSPKTGGEVPYSLCLAVSFISMAGIALFMTRRKDRKK